MKRQASVGRIVVRDVQPVAEDGRWSAKAVVGESFPVDAVVFREGHDLVGASAVLLDPAGKIVENRTMAPGAPGLDQWKTRLTPTRVGQWSFRVEGWADPFSSWEHDARIKIPQDLDAEMVLATGAQILQRAGAQKRAPDQVSALRTAAEALLDTRRAATARLAAATCREIKRILAKRPLRDLVTASPNYPLLVERTCALVGSWYEIFPRSIGATFDEKVGWRSGNLNTAAEDLERIAGMGFDVVYLPPIHPIGRAFRKGRNNSLQCDPTDPGSPWAIGSSVGGHDAIHPDLGTFEDFDSFVTRARGLGMEVALDLALQCSPDHPWVSEHPEWFTTRVDGSIAYAENPPKKYQDIFPLNFDNDPQGLMEEILRIVRLWISHGVSIFRVDNPHTKPLKFWESLIAQIRETNPEIVFLAEAFTRPAVVLSLAQVGFQQSYTYFTWRNTKEELEEYLLEVAGPQAAWMRPAFWPTTPDILSEYLQSGGPPAFAVRAVLAATGSPTWGIYSGFELAENVARPGSEEAIDNEKYEYRPRNFDTPTGRTLTALLTQLNSIRESHPALQRLRNITIHPTSDPQVLCFSRRVDEHESTTGRPDCVIVVINLDPFSERESMVYLSMNALGLADGDSFAAYDEISAQTFEWTGEAFVRLNPRVQPAHVLHVRSW